MDEQDRDRGWAGQVTRRAQGLSGLTVLDVSASEPTLAAFLTALDRTRLRVQLTSSTGESYTFAWASGYVNGSQIRIQGVLESGAPGGGQNRRDR